MLEYQIPADKKTLIFNFNKNMQLMFEDQIFIGMQLISKTKTS